MNWDCDESNRRCEVVMLVTTNFSASMGEQVQPRREFIQENAKLAHLDYNLISII